MATLVSAGCGTAPEEERSYEIRGQILALRQDIGEVRLAHEDVPGLMQAMTMSFGVQEGESIDGLEAGDLIRATLIVSDTNARLSGIERTGQAPLPSQTAPGDAPPARAPVDVLEPGEPMPDQNLIDQNGEAFALASTRGRAVALTFIYTRCPIPTFCPLMDRHFLEAQRKVEAADDLRGRVQFLSISFDPTFDTPQVLRQHAESLGAHTETWRFLTGPQTAIEELATRFGVAVLPENDGTITHSLRTAVIGPDGVIIRIWSGTEWTVDDLVAELAAALSS